jgi:hypothetical protein
MEPEQNKVFEMLDQPVLFRFLAHIVKDKRSVMKAVPKPARVGLQFHRVSCSDCDFLALICEKSGDRRIDWRPQKESRFRSGLGPFSHSLSQLRN